jgi:hypothetical protein
MSNGALDACIRSVLTGLTVPPTADNKAAKIDVVLLLSLLFNNGKLQLFSFGAMCRKNMTLTATDDRHDQNCRL